MNSRLYTILILVASALMLASAVIALRARPNLQQSGGEAESGSECGGWHGGLVEGDEPDAGATRPVKPRSNSGKTLAERNKAKFDVGEMRNEAEDWIERFRHGTPAERQEVIDELRDDTELILLIADAAESSVEKMTPDELEKERADFEKNYRAQLDYLKTGRLQRMLKTPEEREVIGTAFEAAQSFLERLDAALNAAGY